MFELCGAGFECIVKEQRELLRRERRVVEFRVRGGMEGENGEVLT